jgi:predicted amidohydrolase
MYVVGGSMPVVEGEKLYNEALLATPSGSIFTQKKIHMTRFESEGWGMVGGDSLAIFETAFGKLAITTCYDVEFPELVRPAALAGAEIFAVPSCTDDQAGYYRVRFCGQARAIENQVYVIQSSTVGGLPDVVDCAINYGQAAIMAPCDVPFAPMGIIREGTPNIETTIMGDLDMDLLSQTRNDGTVRTFRDAQQSPTVRIYTVTAVR